MERLQKILAHAGIGSRRACEDVIRQGRVTVDGKVVKELGTKVDARQAKIAVDGQLIHLERMVYYAVSKPKGYVSTNNDPAGRPRVIDILPEIPQRVYTVGRLDEMSTGLILLTNDGELANKLAHPKFGVEKLYRVIVAGTPDREALDKLVEGVWLAEGKVRARRVRVVGKKGQATILEMVLAEGKNREVRRMLAQLGHKVMSLTRIAVGPITLKGLAFGEYRPLSQNEVEMLHRIASGQTVAPTRFQSSRRPQPSPGRGRPSDASEPPRDRDRDSADFNAGGYGSRPPQGRREGPPSSGGPRRSPSYSQGPRDQAGGPRRPPLGSGSRRPESGGGYGSRPPRPDGPPPSQRGPFSGTGRPAYGASGSRPPRPDGPPPSQRRSESGSGRPAYGDSGSRPPRPDGPPPSQRGSFSGTGRPAYGDSGSRPPRPDGPPPSQRGPFSGTGRPAYGASSSGSRGPRQDGPLPQRRSSSDSGRPDSGSYDSRPPRPDGPPPSQRRSESGSGRPAYGAGSGPRPPRPGGGPPSSQRRPTGGGAPKKTVRSKPPSTEPPPRRIIGMEGVPKREGPPQPRDKPHIIKRRPPRSALGPRQPRPKLPGDE
ncbi:pseudouridine synthase [Singulisphaera sp. Ch08]|uniref:Pseudouridine synthase n=1 Tax=Singulisphaera sp. Ch08 TaxID=3120278 RepID=A0AAU7CMX1_9BACT